VRSFRRSSGSRCSGVAGARAKLPTKRSGAARAALSPTSGARPTPLAKQHDGVGAPRPPRLGAALELAGRQVAGHPPQDEIAGRKRVRLAQGTHRDVLGGPRTDAGKRAQHRRRLRAVRRAGQRHRAARHFGGEAADRVGPRGHHARAFERGIHEVPRPRKHAPEREAVACRSLPAEHRRDATGEGRRRLDRDLLPKDGTDGDLEAVPCSRRADARVPGPRAAQQRIGAQVLADDGGVRAEIEHRLHALDDRQEQARVGKANLYGERRSLGQMRHLERAYFAVDLDGAPVPAKVDRFDARRGSRAEEKRRVRPQSYGGRYERRNR
jgi:hypothetical protein